MATKGNFFSVDRRTWDRVCELGSINSAAAYLALAQGSSGSSGFTSWSATSLIKYTGCRWDLATGAIERLLNVGYLERTESSTTAKPRYFLPPYTKIFAADESRRIGELSEHDRSTLDRIRDGEKLRPSNTLEQLMRRGFVTNRAGYGFSLAQARVVVDDDSDLIWLPNTLVKGARSLRDAPIRRLRLSGDLWAMRLLVDLYHAQNLRQHGGISPEFLRMEWERSKIGEWGIYNVWGFKKPQSWLTWGGPFESHKPRKENAKKEDRHPAWDSLALLTDHGLVSFIPHVWNTDPIISGEAEVLHAYGLSDSGEHEERLLGQAANAAALAMLPDFKLEQAVNAGYELFLPAIKTLPNVTMLSVARLHYRPHTSLVGSWYSELKETSDQWLSDYFELRNKASGITRTSDSIEKVS